VRLNNTLYVNEMTIGLTGEQMLELLRAASPSFEGRYREFQAEWEDEKDRPYYLALSAYADHVMGLIAKEDQKALRKVFGAVERLLAEGGEYVKEAVLWGLIEDLQNHLLEDGIELSRVEPVLGVLSSAGWTRVREYWENEGQESP
jgi:hypothetical protein